MSPDPAATTALALMDAPSSTTAISRSSLAEKPMPLLNCGPGRRNVRTSVPRRMAITSASSQARPA